MIHTADPDLVLHHGDALEVLTTMPDESVDCVITSPPYWGLRDYGTGLWAGGNPDCDHQAPPTGGPNPERYTPGGGEMFRTANDKAFRDVCGKCGATRTDQQLGLEPTPDQYVRRMVELFRQVRRVLAKHGTCWVNLGDSYASSVMGINNNGQGRSTIGYRADGSYSLGPDGSPYLNELSKQQQTGVRVDHGLKPKDLVGIPWRVAFALQADGWTLRADIIWAKPNPMPESVTDRPTKAHEYVFLLTKQPRYWFDQEAVREPAEFGYQSGRSKWVSGGENGDGHRSGGTGSATRNPETGRNVRSVWEIATQPFPQAHFATFPEELVRRCLLAGCPQWVCRVCGKPRERIVDVSYEKSNECGGYGVRRRGAALDARDENLPPLKRTAETLGWSDCGHHNYRPGIVLDPFVGSGTVPLVARKHGRHSIGIDLNHAYLDMAAERTQQLSLLDGEPAEPPRLAAHKGLTGGAYSPPGQSPHSNARDKPATEGVT